MSPEEYRTRDTVDSEPKHYQLSYSGPDGDVNGDDGGVNDDDDDCDDSAGRKSSVVLFDCWIHAGSGGTNLKRK